MVEWNLMVDRDFGNRALDGACVHSLIMFAFAFALAFAFAFASAFVFAHTSMWVSTGLLKSPSIKPSGAV